jgi:hypothetical protein
MAKKPNITFSQYGALESVQHASITAAIPMNRPYQGSANGASARTARRMSD